MVLLVLRAGNLWEFWDLFVAKLLALGVLLLLLSKCKGVTSREGDIFAEFFRFVLIVDLFIYLADGDRL